MLLKSFWGQVLESSKAVRSQGSLYKVRFYSFGKAKINQFDFTLVYHYILKFNIIVYDSRVERA